MLSSKRKKDPGYANKEKRLGEPVIRSEKPQALVEFYREVIDLELFEKVGTVTFLKGDDDFDGQPQLPIIFEKSHAFSDHNNLKPEVVDSGGGALHYFAFALDKNDFVFA